MKDNPLLFYIDEINKLCLTAQVEKNPGLWLYSNHGRVSFFMIQALCRMFHVGLNKKKFKHWHKIFKKYEDMMGVIDSFDGYILEFSKNKKISQEVLDYLKSKREKYFNKFEKRFETDKYLNKELKKFRELIISNKIEFDNETILDIEIAIQFEIQKTMEFLTNINYNFTELETQVHDLRRKIRWLGIYSQAFRGVIVLKDSDQKYSWEKKYLTEKIKNSPYNILIQDSSLNNHIGFKTKHFMALTWVIETLGDLKDIGLNLLALSNALSKVENLDGEASEKKARQLLKTKESVQSILQEASALSKEFFVKNKILDGLLIT